MYDLFISKVLHIVGKNLHNFTELVMSGFLLRRQFYTCSVFFLRQANKNSHIAHTTISVFIISYANSKSSVSGKK